MIKILLTWFVLLTIILNSGKLIIHTNEVKWNISKYLIGIHFIYFRSPDSVYSNYKLAEWAKINHIKIARYPGGTVLKGWDWQHPCPTGFKSDPWNPQFIQMNPKKCEVPGSKWMDLDEYLRFCDKANMIPLVGVNYISGILYGLETKSVNRAVSMVKYIDRKGFKGSFYYIGNEDMKLAGGLVKSAKSVRKHALAMKKIDRNIKIFWNDNHINEHRIIKYLSIAGDAVDGCEFHGKWPYGGKKFRGVYSLKQWQNQNPIRIVKRGIFSEKIKKLKEVIKKHRFEKIMFANNEYGLNPKKNIFKNFNRFTKSLVVLDYLQNLFIGGFDMSAFWKNIGTDASLLDKRNHYRMNPMHYGFEMLSKCQGAKMITSFMDDPKLPSFVAKFNKYHFAVYVLNKHSSSQKLSIEFRDPEIKNFQKLSMTTLADTAKGHWGSKSTILINPKVKYPIITELAPLTYNMIDIYLESPIGDP